MKPGARPSGASPALTLTAMSLGFAVVQLDVTVVNVALERIGSSFGNGGVAGLQSVGCWCLLAISANSTYSGLWWQMVLIGAGIGLTVPPMTSALLATVDRKQSGVASGVLNTTRQVGSIIGVALFGSLIAKQNHFISGMHLALDISIVVVLIGAIAAFVAIREAERRTHSPRSQPQRGAMNVIPRSRSFPEPVQDCAPLYVCLQQTNMMHRPDESGSEPFPFR